MDNVFLGRGKQVGGWLGHCLDAILEFILGLWEWDKEIEERAKEKESK